MKVFEAVTSAIAAEGFEYIFALMGDANQDLIVNLGERHGVKPVYAHHESSAVGMADGYARFSGKPGLATVTQGPGCTNATTSLVAARFRRTPLLLLAGHASLRDPYNPQAVLDQHALAMLTVGATVKLESANNVDFCLGEAFRQLKGRKGPFILNLPQDIQHAEVSDENWTYKPMYKTRTHQPARNEDIEEALRLIRASNKPTILCGLGAVKGQAEDGVRALAEHLNAPVATSLYAAGFCSQYPLYMGISGGLGSALTVQTLAESDMMIVIGASLNEWTTHFGDILKNGKAVVQIDERADAFGWFARISVGLEGDAKTTVNALVERLKSSDEPRHRDHALAEKLSQEKVQMVNYDDGDAVDPRRVARYLEEVLPKDDRILVFDGGHAGMVGIQNLSVTRAENWGAPWDFGAIGQGLGIALGACFARPGKRITHITADASFMMNLPDFFTAVRHNLPLTVVVLNDEALGQEKHDLVHKGLNPAYADLRHPNFAALAEAFGARGFNVSRPDDFIQIERALAVQEGPVVVNVRINGIFELPVSWEIATHLS